MAEKLKGHSDPEVQMFAWGAQKVYHYLSPGKKKGLNRIG